MLVKITPVDSNAKLIKNWPSLKIFETKNIILKFGTYQYNNHYNHKVKKNPTSGSNWIKTVPSTVSQLVGFILVAKVFRKAFRILGLDERKGRWVVEQDFHGNFQVNVTWFFAFLSGVLDWIVPNLVWFERSFHSAQVGGQSCPWPLKLIGIAWAVMGSSGVNGLMG